MSGYFVAVRLLAILLLLGITINNVALAKPDKFDYFKILKGWAEGAFPNLLYPQNEGTFIYLPYLASHYTGTNTYVGLKGDSIYAKLGEEVIRLGTIDELMEQVHTAIVTNSNDPATKVSSIIRIGKEVVISKTTPEFYYNDGDAVLWYHHYPTAALNSVIHTARTKDHMIIVRLYNHKKTFDIYVLSNWQELIGTGGDEIYDLVLRNVDYLAIGYDGSFGDFGNLVCDSANPAPTAGLSRLQEDVYENCKAIFPWLFNAILDIAPSTELRQAMEDVSLLINKASASIQNTANALNQSLFTQPTEFNGAIVCGGGAKGASGIVCAEDIPDYIEGEIYEGTVAELDKIWIGEDVFQITRPNSSFGAYLHKTDLEDWENSLLAYETAGIDTSTPSIGQQLPNGCVVTQWGTFCDPNELREYLLNNPGAATTGGGSVTTGGSTGTSIKPVAPGDCDTNPYQARCLSYTYEDYLADNPPGSTNTNSGGAGQLSWGGSYSWSCPMGSGGGPVELPTPCTSQFKTYSRTMACNIVRDMYSACLGFYTCAVNSTSGEHKAYYQQYLDSCDYYEN